MQRKYILPRVLKKLNLENYLWGLDIGDCEWSRFSYKRVNKIIKTTIDKFAERNHFVVLMHSSSHVAPHIDDIVQILQQYGQIETIYDRTIIDNTERNEEAK